MERHVRHFEERLDELSERLLRMGGMVEMAIGLSVRALVDRDSDLARRVIDDDEEIDRVELDVDRICLELLALEHPFARDLRFITTAMKLTTDLERMGDLAVNVSERTLELNQEPPIRPFLDIPLMARQAERMVHEALDAFVRRDGEAARGVLSLDDELDRRMELVFREVVAYMAEDPSSIARALRVTSVARYFERIGDHATNLCEQVVYMVEGRVIKHARRSPQPGTGAEP